MKFPNEFSPRKDSNIRRAVGLVPTALVVIGYLAQRQGLSTAIAAMLEILPPVRYPV